MRPAPGEWRTRDGARSPWLWLVLLLPVVAVLTPRPFPTCDGPSHAALAWVLRNHVTGAGGLPVLDRLLEPAVAWQPNALAPLLETALQGVLSPVWADTVLLLAIFLLLPTGGWYLASAGGRSRADWLLPIAVCLTPAYPLYMGFYNFALGVALALWALGVFARQRGRAGLLPAATFAGLMWLTTVAHMIPAALLAASAGVLWTWRAALGVRRVRRWGGGVPWAGLAWRALPLVLALLPVVIVLGVFHGQRDGVYRGLSVLVALERLMTLEMLAVHLEPMVVVTTLLALGLAALVLWRALMVWRRGRVTPADGFLLLLAGAVLLSVFGPERYKDATYLQRRWVWLAAWLTLPCIAGLRLRPRARGVVALVGTALAVAIYGANLWVDVGLSRRGSRVMAAAEHIEPGHAALVLSLESFERPDAHWRSRLVATDHHLGQWAMVGGGSLDVLHYQLGEFEYFLQHFRPEMNMRTRFARMDGDWPVTVDIAGWTAAAGVPLRYILVTGDASGDGARQELEGLLARLPAGYERVYDDPGPPRVRLWER